MGEPHTGEGLPRSGGQGSGGQARTAGPSLKAIQPSPRHLVIVRRTSCRKFLCRTLFVFLGSVYKVIGRPESSHRTVSKGRFCAARVTGRSAAVSPFAHSEADGRARAARGIAWATGWSLGTSATSSAGDGGVHGSHPGSPGGQWPWLCSEAPILGPRPGGAAAQPGVQADLLRACLSSPPDPCHPSGHWVV